MAACVSSPLAAPGLGSCPTSRRDLPARPRHWHEAPGTEPALPWWGARPLFQHLPPTATHPQLPPCNPGPAPASVSPVPRAGWGGARDRLDRSSHSLGGGPAGSSPPPLPRPVQPRGRAGPALVFKAPGGDSGPRPAAAAPSSSLPQVRGHPGGSPRGPGGSPGVGVPRVLFHCPRGGPQCDRGPQGVSSVTPTACPQGPNLLSPGCPQGLVSLSPGFGVSPGCLQGLGVHRGVPILCLSSPGLSDTPHPPQGPGAPRSRPAAPGGP